MKLPIPNHPLPSQQTITLHPGDIDTFLKAYAIAQAPKGYKFDEHRSQQIQAENGLVYELFYTSKSQEFPHRRSHMLKTQDIVEIMRSALKDMGLRLLGHRIEAFSRWNAIHLSAVTI